MKRETSPFVTSQGAWAMKSFPMVTALGSAASTPSGQDGLPQLGALPRLQAQRPLRPRRPLALSAVSTRGRPLALSAVFTRWRPLALSAVSTRGRPRSSVRLQPTSRRPWQVQAAGMRGRPLGLRATQKLILAKNHCQPLVKTK